MEQRLVNILLTEKLKALYGEMKFEVLSQTAINRISILRDSENTLRAYIITVFESEQYDSEIREVHQSIRRGMKMGESIQNAGFDIIRYVICSFKLNTPACFNSSSPETSGQFCKISIKTNKSEYQYAKVCEILHPELKPFTDMPCAESLSNELTGILDFLDESIINI